MLGKKNSSGQLDAFRSRLDQMLNMNHELVQLSKEVDWEWIESELSGYYSKEGRPSVPVRTMVGMLLLKQVFSESDESVIERWVENPYWQYFTGEEYFQHKPPFNPTDFVHFRKRVGEEGMEKVFSLTVKMHEGSESEGQVQIDTTVQEKNITFPTDQKLICRIMEYVRIIAKEEGIKLRQSYVRKEKEYVKQTHNGHLPSRKKKAKKARKKLKNICGRLLRDLERKMPEERMGVYEEYIELYWYVWNQKRTDKNKIYSLHEPQVNCISKGKSHKKYEFGSKVAVVRNSESGVITGMKSFVENVYDGHALEPALEQCERIRKAIGGSRPKEAVVDRGCKGKKEIEGTKISIPGKAKKGQSNYQKNKLRKKFRARAGIEPVIGHLKHDHRMLRNYLSGSMGDAINALLAGSAFNVKMRLNQIKEKLKTIFVSILRTKFYPWSAKVEITISQKMAF